MSDLKTELEAVLQGMRDSMDEIDEEITIKKKEVEDKQSLLTKPSPESFTSFMLSITGQWFHEGRGAQTEDHIEMIEDLLRRESSKQINNEEGK